MAVTLIAQSLNFGFLVVKEIISIHFPLLYLKEWKGAQSHTMKSNVD